MHTSDSNAGDSDFPALRLSSHRVSGNRDRWARVNRCCACCRQLSAASSLVTSICRATSDKAGRADGLQVPGKELGTTDIQAMPPLRLPHSSSYATLKWKQENGGSNVDASIARTTLWTGSPIAWAQGLGRSSPGRRSLMHERKKELDMRTFFADRRPDSAARA